MTFPAGALEDRPDIVRERDGLLSIHRRRLLRSQGRQEYDAEHYDAQRQQQPPRSDQDLMYQGTSAFQAARSSAQNVTGIKPSGGRRGHPLLWVHCPDLAVM